MKQTTFEFMYQKRRPYKYSQEQREEWVFLYNNGESFKAIERKTGCNYSAVFHYIRKTLKVSDGRPSAGPKKKHTKLSGKQVNKHCKLLRTYGITLEQYDDLLKMQKNLCAICGKPPQGGRTTTSLCVDHDHITGKVRGLLCHKCNFSIGLFLDSIENLERAIAYLKKLND